jgi:hypothetical protein
MEMDLKKEKTLWCNQGGAIHRAVSYAIVPGWVWCVECGCWQHLEETAVACCG